MERKAKIQPGRDLPKRRPLICWYWEEHTSAQTSALVESGLLVWPDWWGREIKGVKV